MCLICSNSCKNSCGSQCSTDCRNTCGNNCSSTSTHSGKNFFNDGLKVQLKNQEIEKMGDDLFNFIMWYSL
jgi:hypothetical protein